MNEIKILIADDHPIFLLGLVSIIESSPGMRVEYVASNGQQALEMVSINKPDVSIIDISMPGIDGIKVAKKIKDLNLNTKVIILTMHKNEAIFNLAMDCGVLGYVIKDNASSDIVNCIKKVQAGEIFISPHIIGFYNNRLEGSGYSILKSIYSLTDTEKKILKFIADNISTNEIAEKLFLSSKTIQNHRFSICKKMELEGVNSLLSFALQNKHVIDLIISQQLH